MTHAATQLKSGEVSEAKMSNSAYWDKLKFKHITHEKVLGLLQYEPETGSLQWRVTRGSTVRPGDEAQKVQMSLMGIRIPTAHVIWFIQTGKWPEGLIERIDQNPDNNRWKNLRETNRSLLILNNFVDDLDMIKELSSGQYSVTVVGNGHGIVVGVYSSYSIAVKVRDAVLFFRSEIDTGKNDGTG